MWRDKAATWALAARARRRGAGRAGPHRDPQLLPRRPLAPARLGLWLRHLPGLRAARRRLAALARRRRVGFNRRLTVTRRARMKFLAATRRPERHAACPAGAGAAQREPPGAYRRRPRGPLRGQSEGAPGRRQDQLLPRLRTGGDHRRAASFRRKKPFCFPSPPPSRAATMGEFVNWVRALPEHKTPSAVDGFFQFLGERFPCK